MPWDRRASLPPSPADPRSQQTNDYRFIRAGVTQKRFIGADADEPFTPRTSPLAFITTSRIVGCDHEIKNRPNTLGPLDGPEVPENETYVCSPRIV
jgi:hypothetical protein